MDYYDGDIVISGIAGRFPDSDDMNHLKENLMNKVDLVSGDGRRWMLNHPDIPQRTGKINNLEKFDADFFGVNFKEAHTMDPMCRMLLEHAYEAIIDAGINPQSLRGTKTGVFTAVCILESNNTWIHEKCQGYGLGSTSYSRSLLANGISYWLGLTGPSYSVDSACSSSLCAMENAYRAIRSGQCDAALVGGSNLCIFPSVSFTFSRLGVLSMDGRCKSFDADADGYCRAEAVGVVYLQKAKDAKRIYATFVHGKINCDGFKEQGITFPSSTMQSTLLTELYEECGVPPTMVSFIEAHGTGTKAGDPEELDAIDRVFCPGRTTPLKIGSIKSNLGHTEPASGICSVAKILIAMETGLIPPNINYKRPREGIKALEEERIKVVTDVTPWDGGYVGVSSFGFGGVNAHILLKSHTKEKINHGAPRDDLPRLVVVSGRTHEAVDCILNDVESRPVDAEYVRLLHDIYSDDIPGHMFRGYTIVGGSVSQDQPVREIQHCPGAKRPICFVFSGMGSQWPGMGASLLRLPVFAAAIKKCDAALKSRNLDIYDILMNKNKTTFDNVLNTFVGIAAVQIGLVDLLRYIGIVPDKIIGHSVGELGSAYADGCLTAEEMILAAYSLGQASLETDMVRGSMADVGLGYENLKGLCPPDIDVASHNGPESSTISGPAEAVKAFVDKLQANNIVAREVPCSNIAYHSRYIAKAGPILLAYLQRVITKPKPRSSKWVSTSVLPSNCGTTLARLSSAEYHTNNFLSSILFEEALLHIPKDAVTIEIAPHGLLQDILRDSLHPEVTNISLSQRGHKDNVQVFLQVLGKLFDFGLQLQLAKLYPDIEFPVSRGTPMISSLIKWEHSDDWFVTNYKMQGKLQTGERTVKVASFDEDYEYMTGHVIDGRNLIPATGYLSLVWETLGMMKGEMRSEISVVIEDIKFLRATTIPKDGAVELTIMIQKGTGSFEIFEGGAAIVTGLIRHVTDPSVERMNLPTPNDADIVEEMSSKDIYKDLRLRGYNYSGMFRGIKSATLDATKGTITWLNNWVAFMDNMLQMSILDIDSHELFVPTGIQKLTIDTKFHLNTASALTSKEKQFTVRRYKSYNAIIAGGIEIRGLKASSISRKKPAGEPVLESYQFIAHRDNAKMTLTDFITMSAHIALENNFSIKVKTFEAIDAATPVLENLVSYHLLGILGDLPLIEANVHIVAIKNPFEEASLPQNLTFKDITKLNADTAAMIVSGRGLFASSNTETLHKLLLALKDKGFLMALETVNSADIYKLAAKYSLDIVLEKRVKNETALLLQKHCKLSSRMKIINVASDNFEWVPKLKSALNKIAEATNSDTERIILVSEKDFESGLLGLVQCLRKEPGGEMIRGYHIQDNRAPEFSADNPFYADQLDLDLGFNVLRANGTWGTYRHLQLPKVVEQPVYHASVNQLVRGDLTSLRWLEGPIQSMSSQKNLARVAYAPINFRDVMIATAKLGAESINETRYNRECSFGIEWTGTDATGRRVMGIMDTRCFSNIVAMDELLTWTIPDSWTLEEAATVPCVYATSCYALHVFGTMKRGDKVLIHAGTGGVGQSAIHLALHEGCEVFTTVGTPEKRRFIRETFPQIPDDHIGNSRDTSFEQMIAKQTNGYGVDIVLNSLAEEKLQASVRCLAFGGRFLEIGKFDFAANNPLGMEVFLKGISFYGIFLDKLMASTPERKKELAKIMQRSFNEGAIKPLVHKVFSKDDFEGAFRYMASGKHIGKVMIRIHDRNEPLDTPIKALPRYYCRADHSYVILGGLGGFGMELADWLVLRGAKHLVLTSRTGIKNGYQAKRIALWKSYGMNVVVVAGKNAYKREDCEDILNTAAKLGPVDAIFNLAVILKDALMENQTDATFGESFEAKAWGTKQLDQVSRKICPKLRHFVVFSSVVAGRGNAGQSNYGMANSIMERICERRVAEGLPGLAIQWGAVGDVGLVADMQEEHKELVIGGTLQQRISSCLVELDKFLTQSSSPIVASMVVAEKRAGGTGALNIVDAVLNIMGLKDLKTVSTQTSLAELGMDSMMAVEIKQSLEREFEIFLTAQDIRNLNFSKILDMSTKEAAGNMSGGKSADDHNNDQGMKLLLQIFGENVSAQEACLKLQTKEEVGRDEIFLIPGIEGYGSVFNNLAGRLKSPATCLQLLNNKITRKMTITDMADQLLPHVLKRCKNRHNFLIAGYSYGSTVAIEVARKLEAQGMTGRLVLIDGSPELLIALKDQYLSGSKEDDLQTNIILSIVDKVSPSATSKLVVELKKCATWSEKLNALISAIPDKTMKMTEEDQRSLCTAIYYRLAALDTYDRTNILPLRSSIILLKPSSPTMLNISPDYGLGTVSREKVEILTVEGNHLSILDNVKVAAAING